MKKQLSGFLLLLALTGLALGLIAAYLVMRQERDLETNAEAPVIAPSRVEPTSSGLPHIKLDAPTRQRLELRTGPLSAGSVPAHLAGTAHVLDGPALLEDLNQVRAAQADWDLADSDYRRKQSLLDQGQNASASAVESARALLEHARLALDNARARLTKKWGPDLVQQPGLEDLARRLLARDNALVQVDLLTTAQPAVPSAVITLLALHGETITSARLLGRAPATQTSLAGAAFLALVTTNATPFIPASTWLAQIESGRIEQGLVLPRAAVVRHAGRSWVYIETAADTFTRREASLDRPHSEGWLVSEPWPEPVVLSGAQSLLAEEMKGIIQMRD